MKAHSHGITEVNWDGRSIHWHMYSTPTTVNDRHSHMVRGTTSLASGRSDNHVHYYEGVTTFDDGHTHRFRGWTGPPIPLPNGGHYHEFSGETSFDDGHTHFYRGRTGRNFS